MSISYSTMCHSDFDRSKKVKYKSPPDCRATSRFLAPEVLASEEKAPPPRPPAASLPQEGSAAYASTPKKQLSEPTPAKIWVLVSLLSCSTRSYYRGGSFVPSKPAFQVVDGDKPEDGVVPNVGGRPLDAQVYWLVEEHAQHKSGWVLHLHGFNSYYTEGWDRKGQT